MIVLVLLIALALGVVGAVAVLLVRDRPLLTDGTEVSRTLRWPTDGTVSADDVDQARFTVALRGYRMDEVDRVLAGVQAALAERDARIALLESAMNIGGDPGEVSGDDPNDEPSAQPRPSE